MSSPKADNDLSSRSPSKSIATIRASLVGVAESQTTFCTTYSRTSKRSIHQVVQSAVTSSYFAKIAEEGAPQRTGRDPDERCVRVREGHLSDMCPFEVHMMQSSSRLRRSSGLEKTCRPKPHAEDIQKVLALGL